MESSTLELLQDADDLENLQKDVAMECHDNTSTKFQLSKEHSSTTEFNIGFNI